MLTHGTGGFSATQNNVILSDEDSDLEILDTSEEVVDRLDHGQKDSNAASQTTHHQCKKCCEMFLLSNHSFRHEKDLTVVLVDEFKRQQDLINSHGKTGKVIFFHPHQKRKKRLKTKD